MTYTPPRPPPPPGAVPVPPTGPAVPPKRNTWVIPVVAGAAVLFLCCSGGVVMVAASGGGEDEPPVAASEPGPARAGESAGAIPAETAEPEPAPEPEPEPEPEPPGFGAGVWEVGDEIPPGTYVTVVPGDGIFDSCYWARLSGFSGELDDILANDLVDGGSRGRVEIRSSDTGVAFSGGCTWTRN